MRTTSVLIVLALWCASCSYAGHAAGESDWVQPSDGVAAAEPSPDPSEAHLDRIRSSLSDLDVRRTAPVERKVVYTGTLRVEVARVDEALQRARHKIESLGGHLERRDGETLTVRVPAAEFETALAFCRTLGPVLHESQQALDVTDQWRDLSIRLDNARRSRDRLLALLDRAEAVADVLEIERELRRLTTEIEQMEGELKSLEGRVSMATLTVHLVAAAAPPTPRKDNQPSRFLWINRVGADRAIDAF